MVLTLLISLNVHYHEPKYEYIITIERFRPESTALIQCELRTSNVFKELFIEVTLQIKAFITYEWR